MHPDLSRVDALCQAHGYPDAVRDLLREVTAAVQVAGVRSVVLSGSGSRGELIYAESTSGMRWFSDLDLTVVADSLPELEVAAIEERIAELEQRQLQIGARTFHIDVDFTSSESWQQPRQNFQAWETSQTGWILFGEDVRKLIRVEIDPSTCVQSSLNRLWHLLLYLPEGLLRGHPSESDREVFHYMLNRAILDFPLWYLLEEGQSIAGFADRLRYLEENSEALSDPEFPLQELIELVRGATAGRSVQRVESNLAVHYREVLGWYVRMLQRSLRRSDLEEGNLSEVLREAHAEIYPSIDLRRRIWELKLAFEIAVAGNPVSALRWFATTKQVTITAFLWMMHQAAQGILSQDTAAAAPWLQRAAGSMQELWPCDGPLTEDGDLADRWIELRRRFFDFVVHYYRGLQAKHPYYQYVMGASDDGMSVAANIGKE